MCTAEIVHYRVDWVVKKTRQGLKEQARSILHHNKAINQMLEHLQKLEGKRSEIDQYQKLLEVVEAWDVRIDSLEHSQMQSICDNNVVALHYCVEMEGLKVQIQA